MARTQTPYSLREKFSLKNHLFNREKVSKLAHEIANVSHTFQCENFIEEVMDTFSELELKERIHHITDVLEKHIGTDFFHATNIIERALPPELNPERDDDDFGDFIYAPYGEYIMRHGQKREYLARSFQMLDILTRRFSMEFAIRPFFVSFKSETLKEMLRWSKNDNYHVRRFASEGSRPKLPWGMKIPLKHYETREILDNLWQDSTTYVRRSVANHLHDISKIDPTYVFEILYSWKQKNPKNPHHFDVLIRQTLRTLLKNGHPEALAWIGGGNGEIKDVKIPKLSKYNFSLSEIISFPVQISAKKEGIFRVGYTILYPSERGNIRKKIYTLFEGTISPKKPLQKTIKIPLVHRSTRKLAKGNHSIEITINGKPYHQIHFILDIP